MKTKAVTQVIILLFLASMLPSAHAINLGTEIIYDDGSAETGVFPGSPMPIPCIDAVQFTPPIAPTLVIGMRFWLMDLVPLAPFLVHVLDYPSFSEMIIPFEMTPVLGWNDVDLSPYNIVVTGDFVLALEWTVELTNILGIDTSDPDHLRSWIKTGTAPWQLRSPIVPPEAQGNLMIRAVVPRIVDVDIKPGSWPNPIKTMSRGVLPVAICGTSDLDVTTIDPASVRLHSKDVEEGIPPLRWSWEDVATPYTTNMGGGHALGGDGFLDLVLYFDTQEAVMTLTITEHLGETLPLVLRGNLLEEYDSTPILGQDYVRIH